MSPEKPFYETIWDEVKAFFTAGFESVWSGFIPMVEGAVKSAYNSIAGIVISQPFGTGEGLIDDLLASKLIDQNDAGQLKGFLRNAGVGAGVFSLGIYLIIYMQYLRMASTAMTGTLYQNLNRAYTPNPPNAGSVLGAAFIAPEKTAEVRDAFKRNGLSDADIDLMFIAAYRLYDVETIRQAFYRGVIDEDMMKVRMREQGFTDTRINEIKQTWDLIPPPSDILMMVAKEAFEPDQIERYKLDQEFPTEQVEWLKKQGLSQFWSEKYWISHWDYPSPGQVLTLLHRGLIDASDVSEYYRVVEMPPYWREMLMKASYNPYTRVDARRMHKMGVLSETELKKSYMEMGYDEEHADKMTEWTIKYNAQSDKDLTLSQITKGYKNKLFSREDALYMTGLLGFSEEKADYLLAVVDFEETLEIQEDVITAIKDRYINNLIDRNEALDRLGKLNLPAMKVDSLLDRWEVRRIVSTKIPSKTDLDKFLKNKVIDEDKYRSEMGRLGYNWQYTDWYLTMIKKGKM